MWKVSVGLLLRPRLDHLPVWTRAYPAVAPTSIGDALEILEDGVGLRSLLRSLAPAFFSDLPDSRGDSRGFEATRLWWPFIPKNQNSDIGICFVGEGHLSGRELEAKAVGTYACAILSETGAPLQRPLTTNIYQTYSSVFSSQHLRRLEHREAQERSSGP